MITCLVCEHNRRNPQVSTQYRIEKSPTAGMGQDYSIRLAPGEIARVRLHKQTPHRYYIEWVFVPARFRGYGLGDRILKRVVKDAAKNNVELHLIAKACGTLHQKQLENWYANLGFVYGKKTKIGNQTGRRMYRPAVKNNPDEYITLADALDHLPEEGEAVWNHVGLDDWNTTKFAVVTINPVEWFTSTLHGRSGVSIKDGLAKAGSFHQGLVRNYRRQAKALVKTTYLIVNGDELVDGWHRLSAYALEGITQAQAVDLAQEQTRKNPVGWKMPSRYNNTCRKERGGCGQPINEGDMIVLVNEENKTWLCESCGEAALRGSAPKAIVPKPECIGLGHIQHLSDKRYTFWVDKDLSIPYTYRDKHNQIVHLGTDSEEKVHELRQRFFAKCGKELYVRERRKPYLAEQVKDKRDLEAALDVYEAAVNDSPGAVQSVMEEMYEADDDPDYDEPHEEPDEYEEPVDDIDDIAEAAIEEIVKPAPAPKAPAPIAQKPKWGRLPSFPSKGSGNYVEITLKDWEKIKKAYQDAGVSAELYIPKGWKQYALLVNGRVRVSTTVDVRGGDVRGKGVNAIDIVLVKDPNGYPVGGKTKALRTGGWQGRVCERINALLLG